MFCIQDMVEFETPGWDFVGVFIAENAKNFHEFFAEVFSAKSWSDRGFVLAGIDSKFQDQAHSCLKKHRKDFHSSGPYRVFVPGPYFTSIAKGLKGGEITASPKDLQNSAGTQRFSVSKLRPDEAAYIASYWPYEDIPDKVAYFRWLIRNLPQACIRDADGNPASWGLQYQIGAGAARFTLPKYRRFGLTDIFGTAILSEHVKLSAVPYYVDIAVSNDISIAVVTKNSLMIATDFTFVWFTAYPGLIDSPKSKI